MNLPVPIPSVPRKPLTLRPAWRLWWDRLSIYLPVFLMMLLALASYWLLRATPEAVQPESQRAVGHEPDYFMKRFSVKVFEAGGALKTELFGTEARHYPDTGTLVVDSARIRSYNPQRQLSTATAKQITSNDAGTVFVLEGDAVLVRQAGRSASGAPLSRMEFHGEYLRVSVDSDHVMSDRPVLLVRDKDQIVANNLDYQGDTRVAELTGGVRVVFAAR